MPQRFVTLLTVIAILFIFQTGLVPFDFIKGWTTGRPGELFGRYGASEDGPRADDRRGIQAHD